MKLDKFTAEIIAKLDMSEAESTWQSFLTNHKKLDTEINITNVNGNMFKDLEKAASQSAQQINKQFSSGLKSVKFSPDAIDFAKMKSEANKEVKDIANIINKGFAGTKHEMSEKESLRVAKAYTSEISKRQKLEQSVDERWQKNLKQQENKAKNQAITQQTRNENAAYSQLIKEARAYNKELDNIASIQSKINTKDYDVQISNLKSQLGKNSDTAQNYKQTEAAVKSLEQAYTELKTATEAVGQSKTQENVNQANNAYKKYTETLKIAKNEMQILNNEMIKPVNQKSLNSSLNSFNQFFAQNTKAAKVLREEVAQLKNEFENVTTQGGLDNANMKFKDLQTRVAQEGLTGRDMFGEAKNAFSKFSGWFGVAGVTMAAVRQVKEMVTAVKEVNAAQIELKKVSNATNSEINKSYQESVKTAKEYGASVSEVINATADWSRLGYSLSDSGELAEIATLYKNVGDGIDIDTANESLVSTLQGFQLDTSQAMNIIDQFNEVANNFPVDTAGIGEALQRSASSFYAANTDLSKSIALITGANSVVQNPEKVGKYMLTYTVMCA